jgi:hypothetical protein
VTYFNELSQNLATCTEKVELRKLQLGYRFLGRESNPGPPEYEAGMFMWSLVQ